MKITSLTLFSMMMLFFISCGRNQKNQLENVEINTFISKYETVDFTEFKDAFIAVRQRNLKNIVYIVQNISKNYPVYIVTYDLVRDEIIEIDSTALKKKSIENYYTQNEINKLIFNFRKYNFALLQVDSNNNVFINPWHIGDPATLLRLNKDSNEEMVKSGFFYKKYKNKWYLRN